MEIIEKISLKINEALSFFTAIHPYEETIRIAMPSYLIKHFFINIQGLDYSQIENFKYRGIKVYEGYEDCIVIYHKDYLSTLTSPPIKIYFK